MYWCGEASKDKLLHAGAYSQCYHSCCQISVQAAAGSDIETLCSAGGKAAHIGAFSATLTAAAKPGAKAPCSEVVAKVTAYRDFTTCAAWTVAALAAGAPLADAIRCKGTPIRVRTPTC